MRPSNSSCLPSTHLRSSSVSFAHFCFSLPLVMFQSPLISSVVIIVRALLFCFLIRRQRDGKSVPVARLLRLPVSPPPALRRCRRAGLWNRGRFCALPP